MNKQRLLILYLFATLFLISGAAGLMHEIVWERLLELYFGVTMISVTLIVSAYMAGLGQATASWLSRTSRRALVKPAFFGLAGKSTVSSKPGSAAKFYK